MLRRKYELDWERWSYHPRSPLERIPVLSPIRESPEIQRSQRSPEVDEGPLPELLIECERPRRRKWEDESQEYYDGLAKRMRKYYRKIFNVPKRKKEMQKAITSEDKASDTTGETSEFETEELRLLDPGLNKYDTDVHRKKDIPEMQNENNDPGQNEDDNNNIVTGIRESDLTVALTAQQGDSSGQYLSETFTITQEEHCRHDAKDTESDSTVPFGEANARSIDTSMEETQTERIVVQALVHDPPKKFMQSLSPIASENTDKSLVLTEFRKIRQTVIAENVTDSNNPNELYQEQRNYANVLKDITNIVNKAAIIGEDPNTPERQEANYSSVSRPTEAAIAANITTQDEIRETSKEEGSYIIPSKSAIKLKHNVCDDTLKPDKSADTSENGFTRNIRSDESSDGTPQQEHSDRCSNTGATPDSPSPAKQSSELVEESTDQEEVTEDGATDEMDVTEDISHGANQDGSDKEEEITDCSEETVDKLSTITEVTENDSSLSAEETDRIIKEQDAAVNIGEREVERIRRDDLCESFDSHQAVESEIPEKLPEPSTRTYSVQPHSKSVSPDVEVEMGPSKDFHPSPTNQEKVAECRKRAFSFPFDEHETRKRARQEIESDKSQHIDEATQTDNKGVDVGVTTEKSHKMDKGEKETRSEANKKDFGVQTHGPKFEDRSVQSEKANENLETSHEYCYSDGTIKCFFRFKKA